MVPTLAYCEEAAENVGVQGSGQPPAFSSPGSVARSGFPGAYGNAVFHFSRNHQTLHIGCSILYCHQQCTRVPIFPHPCQH